MGCKRSPLTPLLPTYLMAAARRPSKDHAPLTPLPPTYLMAAARRHEAAAARPSAPPAGVGPYARGRTAAGGRSSSRASAPPRGGRGWGAPSPLLAGAGSAPPLNPARGDARRSARRVRALSFADVAGGAPSGLPCRPARALGSFRPARAVLPPRDRRARV